MEKAKAMDPEAPTVAFPYKMDPGTLNAMNADKDDKTLVQLGGVEGIAQGLHTSLHTGLNPDSQDLDGVAAHAKAYGENKFKEKEPPSFFSMLLDAAQDPMIIILLTVAMVTIILGAAVPEQRAHNGWSEGLAVLGTALIVIFIGAGQDYSKELQFQKLNALKDVIEVKVTRAGKQVTVPNTDVVVGDIMFLDTGDKIIADGLLIDTQGLIIDEASLTGESDPIKKNPQGDLWLRSGTSVNEGSGHMLVIAVGENSEWGKTMALVSEAGDDMTPLQEQLEEVATKISKFGVLVAVVCLIALIIKWLVETKGGDASRINDNGPLQFVLYAVTITVVSIPEGLPLAVTLTLAYSMKKMMKDNNFVRVLSACETMGGATAICSDKTGTLTENRMTVVEGWFCGTQHSKVPDASAIPDFMHSLLAGNCALNSKAFLVDQPTGVIDFVGNRTECALLILLRKLGQDYVQVRESRAPDQVKLYGFSSARKMASVLMREPEKGGLRLYNKGAAEWVLKRSTGWLDTSGSVQPMTEAKQEEFLEVVTTMAKRGLRCICLTYRDYPENDPSRPENFFEDPDQVDNGLIAYCIVGIKDPVRQEVPDAVATCQRAGIVVRMVTGDNIHTAQHIAKECGILVDDCIAMEGPKFRVMPASELIPLLPRLRVLARSSPEDKLTLVRMLKSQGEVVAVTGDGTNDAPALKESDVGLAMGIAGTEVSKEAADIIILDDNFTSIVKSVLWGRCVYVNIRKFLVFQLTVNAVALVSAVVGVLYGGIAPLNVLQLLWVNMIMDTLAALALATEAPYPELLDETPHGRHEALITNTMWLHVFAAACYHLFWMFSCLYAIPVLIPNRYEVESREEFHQLKCQETLLDVDWGGKNMTKIDFVCNTIGFCGFPDGDARLPNCNLLAQFPSGVPGDEKQAMCGGNANGCLNYDDWKSAKKKLEKEFDRDLLKSYKPALSILFNIFIMTQVANAFCARRIDLDIFFFKDITKSPIFLVIMLLISVLQVIIIQTPVSFVFKVQPLNGPEWGVTIAIAFGFFLFSILVRLLARLYLWVMRGRSMVAVFRGERVGKEVTGSMRLRGEGGGSLRGSGRGSGRHTASARSAGTTNSGRGKIVPFDPASANASPRPPGTGSGRGGSPRTGSARGGTANGVRSASPSAWVESV